VLLVCGTETLGVEGWLGSAAIIFVQDTAGGDEGVGCCATLNKCREGSLEGRESDD
jgi:hypothetical protein